MRNEIMKVIKRNTILVLVVGLFITYGCEDVKFGNNFLEKAPGVDVTKDTIFSDIKYAEDFLWGAYKTLPYGLNCAFSDGTHAGNQFAKMQTDVLESISDLSQSYLGWGGANYYYNGSYNSNFENSTNGKCPFINDQKFDGIRKSYILIENIDKVPNADQVYKNRLKAEARMVIAVQYTEFFRNFGGVPWLTHAYTTNENITTFPRLTAQTTCDSIVAVIDKAIPDLPWTLDDPETWDGRFTKASALGLKARILLFNASPLFNSSTPYLAGKASDQKLTWHGGYDNSLWKKAADAAHKLIEDAEGTGDYKLYHLDGNSYRLDFQGAYWKRGNGEILISTRYAFKSTAQTEGLMFNASSGPANTASGSTGWGCGNVTADYVEMFPMANGLPITDPASGYDPAFPNENRDPRLYETVMVNGDAYRGRTIELFIGGRERPSAGNLAAMTGYCVRKFILDHDVATSLGTVIQWPYLRLAEIYLSYAEASNEYEGTPSAEAYRCVNIVRNRVGLGNLPSGLSKEQFREAVITERALEFGWEEVRWYDLVRWKRDADFTKTLHGVNTVQLTPFTFSYTKFDLPARFWKTTWSPKWYLSAFPISEINKNYGLIQNPGWE
ncbi:MAG: RagB/SusD family nutrient uptake outer membrane protein [Paludibacter sp.]|nr:RagB/SusD family nutrient uptake outer membrane protein [Paludibacter sp.]